MWFLYHFSFQFRRGLVLIFIKRDRGLNLCTKTVTQTSALGLSIRGKEIQRSVAWGPVCFFVYVTYPTLRLFRVAYAYVRRERLIRIAFSILHFRLIRIRTTYISACQDSNLRSSMDGPVTNSEFNRLVKDQFNRSSAQ